MLKFYHFIIILTCSIFLSTDMVAISADYQEQLIRVGISTSDFKDLEYYSTTLTADKSFAITNISEQKTLINALPGAVYKFTVNSDGFNIIYNGKTILSKLSGPIGINSPGGHIKLMDIKRKGMIPAYRDKIEIVRGASSSDKLSVVNVLHIDDYLKGVVPNELPVSFGFEALKAQAVAARNYAVRPREKPYDQFDICDSVMCQVYFGYYTESPLATKAVEETAGLVALHKGDVITALYSSAPGGFSENYEYAFSHPITKNFPPEPLPYLKAVCDSGNCNSLHSEDAAREFYTTSPPSYDVKSGYYRWSRSWTGTELKNVLNMNLANLSNTKVSEPFVKPGFSKKCNIGQFKDLKVLKRGVSGKVMELKITGSNGSWVVQKELNIRRLLTKNGKALPSANIVFDLYKDSEGNVSSLKLYGGGFGHGVGMSQYGASYMAARGNNFSRILQHYYTDIAIGTIPVILYAESSAKPLKQDFYSPDGTAVLWMENEGVFPVKLKINGKEFLIDEKIDCITKKAINISSYVRQGANSVIFYPPDSLNNEGLGLKMWIEVVKAKH